MSKLSDICDAQFLHLGCECGTVTDLKWFSKTLTTWQLIKTDICLQCAQKADQRKVRTVRQNCRKLIKGRGNGIRSLREKNNSVQFCFSNTINTAFHGFHSNTTHTHTEHAKEIHTTLNVKKNVVYVFKRDINQQNGPCLCLQFC